MAAKVLPDLAAAHRWIDRYRYTPRQQDCEKTEEIIPAGWQHDGDCFTDLQAALLQSGRQ